MTEAELKKEAIQYAVNYPDHYGKGYKHKDLRIAYIAGAKPREKQIAELEKENAELERKLEQTEKDLADYQFNYPTIKELQKENAELKDYRLTTLAKQQAGMSKYALNLEHKLSWYDDQLTKAKELLERFLGLGNLWDLDCKDYFPLRKEAEQFLNEVKE